MNVKAQSPWALQARALDVYRWRQLRERHSVIGAAVRFARDALLDVAFGLRARWRLADAKAHSQKCDMLLLHGAPKVAALKRKQLLVDSLNNAGYKLHESSLQEIPEVLAQRLLAPPPEPVPLRYFGYAAYAQWLVVSYQPKLLLNDRNGSLYSPFLRLALNQYGAKLVHLAHATTVEKSRRLGMNDYDHYLIFGRSSLTALQARPLRFGSSQVILSGSYLVDTAYAMPAASESQRTLLVLGVGPDKEKESGYQRTYELIRDWARLNPNYQVLIKRHPRSKTPFWSDVASAQDNVQVLPAQCNLAQALAMSSVVASIMSNAVIEAALTARPVIYCNLSGDRDIFEQASFFGSAVETLEDMSVRLSAIAAGYEHHSRRSSEFANHHLAHGTQGLQVVLAVLANLYSDETIENNIERYTLPGTL